MKYKLNDLLIDGFKVQKLGKKYSTPLYCYSFKKIKENIINFKNNFKNINHLTCFAVKANPNKILLREIGKLGLGADVVSIGELMMALKAGIKPNKIVFSGVGKTTNEINYAISKKILLINTESKSEILKIDRIAKIKRKKINIGIRLNPNTDAKTLSQISTGKKENKFGVNQKIFLQLVSYLKNSKYLNLKCLSVHIGSQILNHKPYENMLKVVDKLIRGIGKLKPFVGRTAGMRNANLVNKNRFIQYGANIAQRSGTGALSLGATDFLISGKERKLDPIFFARTKEEGKTGRELAAARLANKIKLLPKNDLLLINKLLNSPKTD